MSAVVVDPRDRRHWPVIAPVVLLPIRPEKVVLPWVKPSKKALAVWVHPRIVGHLIRTCVYVQRNHVWSPSRVDAYNHRKIAGSDTWSYHAAGLALDVFGSPWPLTVDPRGPKDAPPASWLGLWEECGWVSGRAWRNPDWPHVEWSYTRLGGRPKLQLQAVDPFVVRPPLLLVAPLTAKEIDLP